LAASAIDLRELARVLWRRRWIIAGTLALVVVGSGALISQITPLYTATAKVMVDPRQANVVDLDQVISGLPANVETIQSEIEVLSSRTLAAKVVDYTGLMQRPEFNPTLSGKNASADDAMSSISLAERTQQRNRVIDRFLATLDVKSVGRSRVIDISFKAADPKLAADVTNAVAELYLVAQLDSKFDATRRATEWLNERLEQLRIDAEVAEIAVERFKTAMAQNRDAKSLDARRQEITTTLAGLRTTRDTAKLALSTLQKFDAERAELNNQWPSEELRSRYEAWQSLESDKLSKSRDLGPRHPEMQALTAKLDTTRARYEDSLNQLIAEAENQLRNTEQKLVELQAEMSQITNLVDDPNAADVRLRTLTREAQASRTLYETFLNRYKETSEQQGLEQADARLISKADIPFKPSYPNPKMLLLLSVVAGLGLGVVLAFAAEQLENGFQGGEQLERTLGLPALGLMPSLKSLGVKDTTPEAYLVSKPASSYAEAVRGLRTSLLLSDLDNPPKVLLLTSAVPGEGKTTLTLALAKLASMAGERVVVVDADLRRPRVHAALGVENDVGLSDYLSGQKPLEAVLRSTEATGKGGIHYITSGASTPLATELVRSQAMRKLIRSLGETYSLVLVDGPPVLPVADAKVLATMADKVVYISLWRKTPRSMAQHAVKQLRDVGANLAGAVLNNVDVKRHSEYGYGEGSYYHNSAYRKYYAE
jgi:capsular exopolysaccharide synthesis family protein